MGQAKKRGTFEERKAQAVEREAEERRQYMARAKTIQRPRGSSQLGMMLAAVVGLQSGMKWGYPR